MTSTAAIAKATRTMGGLLIVSRFGRDLVPTTDPAWPRKLDPKIRAVIVFGDVLNTRALRMAEPCDLAFGVSIRAGSTSHDRPSPLGIAVTTGRQG